MSTNLMKLKSLGRGFGSLSHAIKMASQSSQFHTTAASKSGRFFPINDDIYGLGDEQKQVRKVFFLLK